MRTMVRNKRAFYYAPYVNKTEIEDENGNSTGEYEVHYGNPIKMHENISAAMGEIQTRQFGENVSYDKVIVFDNPNTPIDEYSILWVDTLPVLATDGTTETPHDYIVKKVARSTNELSVAISKVTVRG